MYYPSVKAFLDNVPGVVTRGPIAMIFVEDEVEIGSTLRHALDVGFRAVLALMPDDFVLPADLENRVWRIGHDLHGGETMSGTVNTIAAAGPGSWFFYCYNAEYLFYPFAESRTVGEMLTFHTEERRDSMLTYVIDLYAGDLDSHRNAVSLENAMIDKTGYYALARAGGPHGHPMERQLDFFGGLRWRFEEHVPGNRRKIDRISLFRARKGLELDENFTFNEQEYNTYSCEWHNNLTAAVVSFRTAKALKTNPGSTFDIGSFRWHNSVPFAWHSRQLLDLGLMEPGQWF